MRRCVSRGSADGYSRHRASAHANVAQLVERNLAKVEVASSNLVVRSTQEGPGPATGAFFMSYCQVVPVRSSYASRYFARVASTISCGSAGGGCSLFRSQPEAGEVSQSRTNCLSYEG